MGKGRWLQESNQDRVMDHSMRQAHEASCNASSGLVIQCVTLLVAMQEQASQKSGSPPTECRLGVSLLVSVTGLPGVLQELSFLVRGYFDTAAVAGAGSYFFSHFNSSRTFIFPCHGFFESEWPSPGKINSVLGMPSE